MRVAGQHQAAGTYRAGGAADLHGIAVNQFEYRTLLEDPHPQRLRHPGFAEHQVERVQVAGAHVDQTTGIGAGCHHLAHVPWLDNPRLMAVAQFRQVFLLGTERCELRWGIGQFAEAPAQVAVDGVLADPLADHRHRLDAGTFQVTHAILADVPGEAADIMTDATDQLAAIASAGAPADASTFEQDDRKSALGQFDRRVDTGEAAADHADVGRQLRLEPGSIRQRVGGRSVIGTGMFRRAVMDHLLVFTLLQERVIRRMISGFGVVEMYSLSRTSCGG